VRFRELGGALLHLYVVLIGLEQVCYLGVEHGEHYFLTSRASTIPTIDSLSLQSVSKMGFVILAFIFSNL